MPFTDAADADPVGSLMRARRLCSALIVVTLLMLLGVARAEVALAGSAQDLDLHNASNSAVDLVHGRLFTTEGRDFHTLLVTDLQGNTLGRIADLAGPTGVTVMPDGSAVFVVTLGAVLEIDPLTLEIRQSFPMLPVVLQSHDDLMAGDGAAAYAGGLVWFKSNVGLATLNPTTGEMAVIPTAYTNTDLGPWNMYSIATAAADPTLMVAASGTTLYVYRTSGGQQHLVSRHNGNLICGVQCSFALSPDGSTIYYFDNGLVRAPLDNPDQTQLLSEWTGPTGNPAVATTVAVSPDGGALFVGLTNGQVQALDPATGAVLAADPTTFWNSYMHDYPVIPGGLVAVGGRSAIGISTETRGDPDYEYPTGQEPREVQIFRLTDDPTSATILRPMESQDTYFRPAARDFYPPGPVAVKGSLTGPDVVGKVLTLTRTGPMGHEITVELPPMMTAGGPGGAFWGFQDTVLTPGLYRYHVTFAGTGAEAGSTANVDIDVATSPLTATTTELPDATGVGHVVSAAAGNQFFVTLPEQNEVVAVSSNGLVLATIPGIPGAMDLTTNTEGSVVYITAPRSNEVVAIDAVTHLVLQRWSMPATPHSPVPVNGKILVAVSGGTGYTLIDPLTGSMTQPSPAPGVVGQGGFVANPHQPGTFAVGSGGDRYGVQRLDGDTITQVVPSHEVYCTNAYAPDAFTVDADGDTVYCGTKRFHYLDPQNVEAPSMLANAVGSPDGKWTAGDGPWITKNYDDALDAAVKVQPAGATNYTASIGLPASRRYEAATSLSPAPTWASDSQRLLLVGSYPAKPGAYGYSRVELLTAPLPPELLVPTLHLDLPLLSGGSGVSLTGTLADSSGAPLSGDIRVYRVQDGTSTLLTATLDSGQLSLLDTGAAPGPVTYRAYYAGSSELVPVSARADIVLPAPTPVVTPTVEPSPTDGPTPSPVATSSVTPTPTPSPDTQAPTVAAVAIPSVTLGPVRFSYTGQDSGAGLASFDVRLSRAPAGAAFGGYTYPAAWQQTKATGVSFATVPGSTYCLGVRDRDRAGNVSEWTQPVCAAAPLDERSLAASSGWSTGLASAYYRSTISLAQRPGLTLSTPAVARRLTLVATTCSDCGTLQILWNGRLVRTVSLRTSRTQFRAVIPLASFGSVATGTLVLRTTSNKRVYIDGVVVGRV